MPPTPDDQLEFLVKLQRLLDEGLFVASYKFALLLALADLSIEGGDDSGRPLPITTEQIAGKFIQYYWRQAVPYVAPAQARVLQQNTGKQASVVNIVQAARNEHGDSLAALIQQASLWDPLVRKVAGVVRQMPVRYLQTVGREKLEFLYDNAAAGRTVELKPGVAFCLRKFHSLISDLVRGAWVRYVRQQNLKIVGEITDLNEFLFGSERAPLAVVRPVLWEIQSGRCFYCPERLNSANTHVDHFIPWSRYSVDLGHNFVLADSRCNGKKRNRLPACEHLAAWTERNARFGDQIGKALEERGIVSQLAASNRVAQWAYDQTEAAGGLTWLKADEMVPLAPEWRGLLASG
jgi:5-methylcytosine-specific restriction endonuclease McrA